MWQKPEHNMQHTRKSTDGFFSRIKFSKSLEEIPQTLSQLDCELEHSKRSACQLSLMHAGSQGQEEGWLSASEKPVMAQLVHSFLKDPQWVARKLERTCFPSQQVWTSCRLFIISIIFGRFHQLLLTGALEFFGIKKPKLIQEADYCVGALYFCVPIF